MGDGRRVLLVEPDDTWRHHFQIERTALERIFGGRDVTVEHIGSTAIGTIRSKPVLDILVGVSGFAGFDEWLRGLHSLEYEYDAEAERTEPLRKVFRKGPKHLRTHHLHLTVMGGRYWERILAFRDYLVVHVDVAREYEALKAELASRFPNDGRAYTAGKAEFVHRVEALARSAESF